MMCNCSFWKEKSLFECPTCHGSGIRGHDENRSAKWLAVYSAAIAGLAVAEYGRSGFSPRMDGVDFWHTIRETAIAIADNEEKDPSDT